MGERPETEGWQLVPRARHQGVARPIFFCLSLGPFMVNEKISLHPNFESNKIPPILDPSMENSSFQSIPSEGKKDGPLQRLLTDSGLEELELQLKKPIRLVVVDLAGIATRAVSMLSAMSSELGVILRLRIREEGVPILADSEILRRSIDALIIHLLTLSPPQACVTVIVESRAQNGKRGMAVRLYSDQVIGSWKSNMGVEEEYINSQEVSASRRLLERIGGTLSVQSGAEEGLSFLVWLPLKGQKGKSIFHG